VNTSEKVAALFDRYGEAVRLYQTLGYRWFSFQVGKGYLTIDDQGDKWNVMWTSGRDVHNRGEGSAYSINVSKKDGEVVRDSASPTGVWKSALSMWPVRDKGVAAKIVEHMRGLINLGYQNMTRAV